MVRRARVPVAVGEHSELDAVIGIETDADRVDCWQCGVIAKSKHRRWVTLRDAPAGDRPVTLRWRKRIWQCVESACTVKTWTEQRPDVVLPRHSLTERVGRWAPDRVSQIEAIAASLARQLGVTWPAVWAAIVRNGTGPLDMLERSLSGQVGFDETVMSPAKRHRRRRFITAAVDVCDGRIIDVFKGRNAGDVQAWLGAQPDDWVAGIKVVSVDPHEGYRSAITAFDLLTDVTVVVDPFHIVRLANGAVTKCRQRIQQATLAHRGWKGDALYGIRKLLLMAAEHLDEQGWGPLHRALAGGDLDGQLQDAWVAKEYVRDIYLTDDPDQAQTALDRAVAWCTEPDAGPELRILAKTLRRWRDEILAHHTTGASNGKFEGREPDHQAGQARRPRVPQPERLPAPHLARRRLRQQDSPRHHHTEPDAG